MNYSKSLVSDKFVLLAGSSIRIHNKLMGEQDPESGFATAATPNARDPSKGLEVSSWLCLVVMEAGRVCRTTDGPVSELVSQQSSWVGRVVGVSGRSSCWECLPALAAAS